MTALLPRLHRSSLSIIILPILLTWHRSINGHLTCRLLEGSFRYILYIAFEIVIGLSIIRQLFKTILHFYLYSSLHIALCAIALTIFCSTFFGIGFDTSYVLFIGSSTFLTYSMHRLIGIRYSHAYLHQPRFAVVKDKQHHIMLYAAISAAYCLYLYLGFTAAMQLHLLVAGVISIAYTLPLLGNGKRLRDLSFIKIFLIASVWSYVTIAIPLIQSAYSTEAVMYYSTMIFCFMMAITIPFDIRDLGIDKANKVPTLASALGVNRAKWLSTCLLIIAGTMSILDPFKGCVVSVFFVVELGFLITGYLVWKSQPTSSDYWYTGVLDGSMMLFLFIYELQKWIFYSLLGL